MEVVEPETVDPYARELEEFGRAVGGAPPRLGRADALGQARTIQALYRAAETGRRRQPVIQGRPTCAGMADSLHAV